MKKTLLFIFSALALSACAAKYSAEDFTIKEQKQATEELVDRVTGGRADEFSVVISPDQKDGKDWFLYHAQDGRVVLEGNNGVSVASALGHYLKTHCGWHLSWCGSQQTLPQQLPLPDEKYEAVSPYKYRYYLNYCTFNYSMSWWDFERWQQEIDFMALNGINMPLALTGQNSVWQRVYRRLGFTDKELEGFFSGPAYFNWFWMGNLDGWGGPLPQSFMDDHEKLQKQILHAERSLGMTPVLPAFTGHVPPTFEQKFPEAKVRKTEWVNFPEVSILDPEEELFTEIGKMFIQEQTALYGTDHFYSADTFNENTPPTNDSTYLAQMSAKVYSAMSDVDPDAVWVMQGWLFYHEREFWGENQIKALLGAVPDENMLILDLWSERHPVWNRTEAYYGKPWVWCMLHNFGQNINMSGNLTSIANDPANALNDPSARNMAGIGLTMEGIGQNPMVYAMMLENVWRDRPVDKDEFLRDYLSQRYGCCNDTAFAAWQTLMASVYENTVNNGGQESIITGRPSFKVNPGGTTNTKSHYDKADLITAWKMLVSCAGIHEESDGFRYDLVDVTRQVLADYASILQQKAASRYQAGDVEGFKAASEEFLALIDDMDKLLGTRSEFLLGRWLDDARSIGHTDQEKDLYEHNARNQITLWGNRDCRIRDYACKHWNGMMAGFYRPRWERFFDTVSAAMEQGVPFDEAAFIEASKDWEWEWTLGHEKYPNQPVGSEIEECLRIWDKYHKEILNLQDNFEYKEHVAAYV
jgi:alpha-N-acetylglucosaminidase